MNKTVEFKPLVKPINPEDETTTLYIPSAVAKKKQIPVLYVTDMPFTSNSAVNAGLPVVGYAGICDQYSDSLKHFETGFTDLLRQKKTHTIVLLYNSDAVDLHFNPRVDSEKDLAQPLHNLFYAVKNFRHLLFSFDSDITLIYANINHHFYFDGLTTVDQVAEKYGPKIFKSLTNFRAKSNEYLSAINISEQSTNKLYNHLKLKNVNDFYSYHADKLKSYEFTYKSVAYHYDGDKLEKLSYSDVKFYLRAGPDFYKRTMLLNPHGELEEVLSPWRVGEISRDYSTAFIKDVPRYDSFTNQPSNNAEYQRTITLTHNGLTSELYNLYNPVDWDPAQGEWPNIEMFLRHIFTAKNVFGECLYEWALDYMQLTYTMPRQRLPILALVSKQKNTGKTTLLDLHKLIYGANITILDNARFNPKFTSHFAGKLIIALDEGHIPVNDKITKEMIKSTATGREMWMEGKGTNAKPVANFAHLIFVSNDELNFMQIDAGENRFAVVKVPSFREQGKKDIPDLLDKMKPEIPAFLHFLINRNLQYPNNETRFWFPDKAYLTEAFQAVVDKTKTTLEKELEEWLNDCFLEFEVAELNYTLTDITIEISRATQTKFPKDKIRELLSEVYHINPYLPKRYMFYSRNEKGERVEEKKTGRCCTFYRKDWVFESEILPTSEN